MQIQTIVVLILTLVCAITDLRNGKIYNKLTYPTALLGLILSFFLAPMSPLQSLLGLAGALLVYGFLRSLSGMGAGDVKLLGAIGALKGFAFVIYSSLYIFFAAALVAIVLLVGKGRLWQTVKWVFFTLISVIIPALRPAPLGNEKTLMPFAPAICIGTAFCLYLEAAYGRFVL